MKKIISFVLICTSLNIFSQTKTLDKIAKATCERLQNDSVKSLTNKEKELELGLYILKMYSKHSKELKKEGIEFDLSKGEEAGEAFGQKVGFAMVKFCPEVLMALAADDIEMEEDIEEGLTVQGTIVGIQGKEFSSLIIRDVNGKTQKFVWISNFKGSDKLILEDGIKDLKVEVTYKNIECYSPQLKEYISRKQITGIKYL